MERYGKSYISPRYTMDDYVNLNLELDSPEYDWKRGIDIFSSRLQKRYFDVIYSILNDVNSNGFAIMALECLLIETLYQFREGLSTTPFGKNKKVIVISCYKHFLRFLIQAEKRSVFIQV